jgi:CMP-N,N'-diacetyllegionaminic acid synthase
MKRNVVAIIPARSGSKSVKDKNIKILGKIPLIAWSINLCKKSKLITKIVVSTDSKKYANIAKKFGASDVILRPKNISQDKSTDYELIDHVIKYLKFKNYNYIALIRPTTPLRKVKIVDKALKFFIKSKYNSLRSIHQNPETSYKTLEISSKNFLKPLKGSNLSLDDLNKPKEFFRKTYIPNGYIDIFKKNFILKNKKLLGNKVYGFITENVTEVDSLKEYEFLKYQVKNKTYLR